MGTTAKSPRTMPSGLTPDEEAAYHMALEEARAQAEALRRAVCTANDVVRQLEELLESLRAILAFPKAYDWPPDELGTSSGPPCEEPAAAIVVPDGGATPAYS
jgi:hypothetical protein